MVKNLAAAGYDVTIFDLSPAAIDAARSVVPGLKVADSPALAATKADAVVTMLPGPAQIQVRLLHILVTHSCARRAFYGEGCALTN